LCPSRFPACVTTVQITAHREVTRSATDTHACSVT
jgi:hypothetical protein